MGVYSEMAADLRDDVQEHTTTVQDAAELAARRADERQQAEEEQARAMPPHLLSLLTVFSDSIIEHEF